MDTIYLILFEATLLVCLFIVCLLWRAKLKNKALTEENQRLRAEVERRDGKKQAEEANLPPPRKSPPLKNSFSLGYAN